MLQQTRETSMVQLGNRSDLRTGAVNPPIYLSTAFKHDGIGQSTGYDYSRTKNPTRSLLEEGVAKLESGKQAFACSSGMAAIQLVLSLFQAGDEIIASEDIYGGTYRLLEQYTRAYHFNICYDPFTNFKETETNITNKTKAIFIETPTNPLMQEIDITSIAHLTKKHDLLLIVDNTFLTPYLQRPLELGADIVIHSATKYIGGHNDVLAGLVVTDDEPICEQLAIMHNTSGAVLSPFDSWLLIRGLKTLSLRMEKHETNAQELADFLNNHQAVKEVLYPGKGGMLSFRLHDNKCVDPFLQQLQLITFAESLGGVESFITYPATQTHADIPINKRTKRGIDDCLLRFSVGIEHVNDLKHDLQNALQAF
ncbi:methionine biosynthesis PLP-dependent protein [Virgibacillus chiguensis]|uniref:Cystathionine gamma-synthase n=1 Tax=Virgibacillus chiguensis TaxID=411959 RepID=A0A1M5X6F1_9BACI|nr:methionine biosynthesis PLP-dependent protein [Virgibacillus chiguensis]SHH94793.1 cystathionine gamma-synthase [Virgibacillus chiguensis]